MNETDFINGFERGFERGFEFGQKQAQNEMPVVAIPDNNTVTYISNDNAPQIWIVRDSDDSLWLYRTKPEKGRSNWSENLCNSQLEINAFLFPEVKWTDTEPKRVKLILVEE